MLKKVSMVFGVIFLLLGLLGFVPAITATDTTGMQQLFGIFMIDTLHNFVHIISGVAGLIGATHAKYAKWYLVGFGVVYGLVTVVGFFDSTLLGLMHVNLADNLLHLVLTLGLLGAGLGLKEEIATNSTKAVL